MQRGVKRFKMETKNYTEEENKRFETPTNDEL